jgi:bile acid:Na+ symporter, BASS family
MGGLTLPGLWLCLALVVAGSVCLAVGSVWLANKTATHEPERGLTTPPMGALEKAVPIATLVFVVSSMLAMGLGLKVAEVTAPLRNLRLVLMSLLANFVLMPAGAVLLARLLRLEEPLGVGLLLLGAAAGAPFLPKLTQIAKGNLAFAVALMVLLMVITVGYMPLVLPILLPGVSVNPARIASSLVLLMLLPLAVALAVNAKLPGAAARAKPLFDRLSSLGLILVVVLLVVVNFNKVLSVFGTRAILAGLLFIALGYAAGWALGGPATDTRPVLGLGTAQRNIAAALVVGSQSFNNPSVVVMVVVVAIVSLLILLPMSRLLARKG